MGNIEDKEENVRSLLDSFAGRMKMKKTRPISNIKRIKEELESAGLNKDENLVLFKGYLKQGESDRGVYDVSVSLFALIMSFLSFFSDKCPIWWVLPLIAVILSFVAIFYWTCNQRKTQYFAEMYEIICCLEKDGFFKKHVQSKESEVEK